MKKKIQLVLFFLILGFAIYYFFQKGEELQKLKGLSIYQIGVASLVVLLSHSISGLKYKKLFKFFNVNLTVHECFGLPQIRKLGNLLFFKSGTLTNAYYLKTQHQLSYSKFIIAISILKFIQLFCLLLMTTISCFYFYLFHGMPLFYTLSVFSLLAGLLFLFLFPQWKIPEWKPRYYKKIQKLLDIWNDFKNNKFSVLMLIYLEILSIFAIGSRFYVAFHILEQPVSFFFDCIVMSLIVSLTGFIGLVPGGLGIREIVVGLAAMYFDYSFDYGIIATSLDRILSTLWFGIFGFIYFHFLHMKEYVKDSTLLSDSAAN
tara:strand:- start:821 stop:1771 length:951 start_codon:yes stop_codon:yes gene_type:complete